MKQDISKDFKIIFLKQFKVEDLKLYAKNNKFKNYSDVNQEDITNILVDSDFKPIRKNLEALKKINKDIIKKNKW